MKKTAFLALLFYYYVLFSAEASSRPVLSVTPFPARAEPGQVVTQVFTLLNDGADAATNIELTCRFYLGAAMVSATPTRGTITSSNSREFVLSIGNISPGESISAQIDIALSPGVALSSAYIVDPLIYGPVDSYAAVACIPVRDTSFPVRLAIADAWTRRDAAAQVTYFPIGPEFLPPLFTNTWIMALDEQTLDTRVVMPLPRMAHGWDLSPEGRWAFYFNNPSRKAYQLDLQEATEGVSYSMKMTAPLFDDRFLYPGLVIPPHDPHSVLGFSNYEWFFRGSANFDQSRSQSGATYPSFGATRDVMYWINNNNCSTEQRTLSSTGLVTNPGIAGMGCNAANLVFSMGKLFGANGYYYDPSSGKVTNALKVTQSLQVYPAPERGLIYQYGRALDHEIRVFNATNYSLLKSVFIPIDSVTYYGAIRLVGQQDIALAKDATTWTIFRPLSYQKPVVEATVDWRQIGSNLVETLSLTNPYSYTVEYVAAKSMLSQALPTNIVMSTGTSNLTGSNVTFNFGNLLPHTSATAKITARSSAPIIAESHTEVYSWFNHPRETAVTNTFANALIPKNLAAFPTNYVTFHSHYGIGAALAAFDPRSGRFAIAGANTNLSIGSKQLWIFDGLSGILVSSLDLAGIPDRLFLRPETSQMYITFSDRGGVQQLDLLQLILGPLFAQTATINDLEPVPGDPSSVVISDQSSTTLYRGAVAAPKALPTGFIAADPGGPFYLSANGKILKISVSPDGLDLAAQSLTAPPPGDFTALNDRLFFKDGSVLEFPSLRLLTNLFAGMTPPLIDVSASRIYQPRQLNATNNQLVGYDLQTFEIQTMTPTKPGTPILVEPGYVGALSGTELYVSDIAAAFTNRSVSYSWKRAIDAYYAEVPGTIQLVATNFGMAVVTDILMTNTVTPHFEIKDVKASAGSFSISNNFIRWELPTLGVAASATLTLSGIPHFGGDVWVNGQMRFPGGDLYLFDNYFFNTNFLQKVFVTISDARVFETTGTNTVVKVSAQLSGDYYTLPLNSEVTLMTLPGSADPNDFIQTTKTIVFTSSLIDVPVVIVGDAIPEPSEYFYCLLTNSTKFPISRPIGKVQIIDDDDQKSFFITPYPGTINETNQVARIEIGLSAPQPQVVKVHYQTHPVTAVPGVDFTQVSGTLEFPAGALAGWIEVPVLKDNKIDINTFEIVLDNPSSGVLLQRAATWTIHD